MRHFIFIKNNITAQNTALLFINNIYAAHRFPNIIVLDRGLQFISLFWKTFDKYLGINRFLSTAFYPETDN